MYKRPENRVHSRNSAIHKIMHCYLGPIVVHFLSTCDYLGFYTWIHGSLDVKFALVNSFFCVSELGFFLSTKIHWNVLEYVPVLRVVRRWINKNKIVWLQDFRAIARKINLDIVRNFAKSSQLTIFWLFAYGAVLSNGFATCLMLGRYKSTH